MADRTPGGFQSMVDVLGAAEKLADALDAHFEEADSPYGGERDDALSAVWEAAWEVRHASRHHWSPDETEG